MSVLWRGKTLVERFWSSVNKDGPISRPRLGKCWVWIGAKIAGRYGSIGVEGKSGVLAHRVSWYLHTGRWPRQFILHKCDNGFCVRPSHLFQGTQKENVRDMVSKGRRVANPRKGEDVVTSKLTRKNVRKIRKDYASGAFTQLQLAKRHSVSQTNIGFVVRGGTWAE